MKFPKLPETAHIYQVEDVYILTQMVDYQKMELKAKIFISHEEAVAQIHEWSFLQNSEWHYENCDRCKK